MLGQLIRVLFFGATVLIVGCNRSPAPFEKEVAGIPYYMHGSRQALEFLT